jgi:hypothetical protein
LLNNSKADFIGRTPILCEANERENEARPQAKGSWRAAAQNQTRPKAKTEHDSNRKSSN